jgi:hypothetical protein
VESRAFEATEVGQEESGALWKAPVGASFVGPQVLLAYLAFLAFLPMILAVQRSVGGLGSMEMFLHHKLKSS